MVFLWVCFIVSLSFAEERADLKNLTIECRDAAGEHRVIQKDFPYKVLHRVQYEGWSGDANTFQLTYPVAMTISYAGADKKGYYWFKRDPQTQFHFTAKSDMAGNIELVEGVRNGVKNYQFRGLMKNGVIKGIWEKGDGKNAYAFYVNIVEDKHTIDQFGEP